MSKTVCTYGEFFGATFRKLRKEKNLSQHDIATAGGFDRSYVTLIELGKKNPTMSVTEKMATIVSPSIHAFMSEFTKDITADCAGKRNSGKCPMIASFTGGVCPTSGYDHDQPDGQNTTSGDDSNIEI